MIKTITAYETSDGKIWRSMKQAEAWQQYYEIETEALKEYLGECIQTNKINTHIGKVFLKGIQ